MMSVAVVNVEFLCGEQSITITLFFGPGAAGSFVKRPESFFERRGKFRF